MANRLINEMGLPKSIANIFAARNIKTAKFCLKLALLASLPSNYGGLDGHVIYVDVESKFSSRRMIEIGSRSFPEVFFRKGMAKEMAGRILVLQPGSTAEFTESLQQIKVSLLRNKLKLLIIDSMAAVVSGYIFFPSSLLLSSPSLCPAGSRMASILKLQSELANSRYLRLDASPYVSYREYEQSNPSKHGLGWHISFIKSLAELSRIPVVVTNQVRSHIHEEVSMFPSQRTDGMSGDGRPCSSTHSDFHLIAAMGTHWAHAVSVRLILEAVSGQRFMKIAKSPISPPLQFRYEINASGISFLSDGVEVSGPQINAIHSHG
ncbi:hypothetical protein Cgig2_020900 [Carnegiea gigantea]|uniref:RecA family profile 1 domain-containing protein n=1 Tax=Carnegiea gigantea TaxID=171969 RepID=A0A9Q1JSK2_9CARY|nr:hypothetical protein Cgig2_020900 [Carnegiea gigantea]